MRLAALADRQHGVVSARQLAELGYSPNSISRSVAAGRLHRLHRGVYAVGYTRLTWKGHCLSAVLACAPRAVASHQSAARLWGIAAGSPTSLHVTAPTRRHPRPGMHLHYAALAREDRAIAEGIPLTSLARTLLDLAATLPPRRVELAVERAEQQRLFDLKAVEAVLERARGHAGGKPLRRALALYRDDPAFLRSPLERRFLDLVAEAGLPRPATNVYVEGHEIDAYWERERFAVELDGFEHHRTRRAFENDRRRQEDLKLAGIEMLRVTARRISEDPRSLAERLAILLERRLTGAHPRPSPDKAENEERRPEGRRSVGENSPAAG